ncbi:hypothetical protein [Chryseobacterium sp. CT-SW4]|uniref:hypothetical protein n=1 Tax=Chryseobacterium sp. SW-1 TaxID=3157343 RepID=UPI003B01428F
MKKKNESQIRIQVLKHILKNIPENVTPASYLSEILYISLESAYRRLRGEVSFSAEEVILLSHNLNFSIDEAFELKKDLAVFNLDGNLQQNTSEFLYSVIRIYDDFFKRSHPANVESFSSEITGNHLLHIFLLLYKNLFKFFYFQWARQKSEFPSCTKLSEISIPADLESHRLSIVETMMHAENITYIFDKNTINSTVDSIMYFFRLGLLDKEELMLLSEELSLLIRRIEEEAASGTNKIGNKRNYYIANHVDSNTMYSIYNNVHESFFWMYSVSPVRTNNKKVCVNHKEWIETLKKYSIPISKANEFARFEYINTQRRYLSSQMKFECS